VKSFGELIARRRKELCLTQTDLAGRIKGRSGEPVSQQRITDIEHDRFGVPRRPILEQLARALKLDIDVLYLWGRVIPSDIRAEGLSEEIIKEAWRAFRAIIERERKISRRRVRLTNTVVLSVLAVFHEIGPGAHGGHRAAARESARDEVVYRSVERRRRRCICGKRESGHRAVSAALWY
jgi:transcriptional regulator with XRE-family HTH domain